MRRGTCFFVRNQQIPRCRASATPRNETYTAIRCSVVTDISERGAYGGVVRAKRYCVYLVASKSRVIYVGMTSHLMARILQHKAGEGGAFTSSFRVNRLVYYEVFQHVETAIHRETEIKKWRREKKIALIQRKNPIWEDLAKDWGKQVSMSYHQPNCGKIQPTVIPRS